MPDLPVLAEAFMAEHFALDPVGASHIGAHAHDHRWPDRSWAGRAAWLEFVDRWTATFEGCRDADLSTDERIDRDVLLGVLAAGRFEAGDLREDLWNPLEWVYLLGDGIFPLLARDFAPLAVRLDSVAGRLNGIVGLVDAAIETIGGHPELPVARFHTEIALRDLPGVLSLVDEAVETAEAAAPADADVAGLVPRLRVAADVARTQVARFEAHLRDIVLPAAEGEGRLGRDRFEARLRHTLRSETPTATEILAAAEREYAAVRAEMTRLARMLWPTWCPDRPEPESDDEAVRGAVAAISAEHPDADDLLVACRAELVSIEAFVRERGLVGLADEPLEIQWTPVFLRSFAGAMLSAPGPLDRGQTSFFSITPLPDEWPAERRESYLREYNTRQNRLLTIHEAVPGHYLQGVYANRSTSLVRSVFGSGLYAEGWAVYVTQVMLDVGYAADDPAYALIHWKYYLRAIVNAILDQRIHCDGIGEAEAVALMVEGGFQEEAEARKKYDRARLSSGQLSTYFVGSLEFWAIEREVRRRLAAASGDPGGAAAVPERDLPGGFGETPGFVYRPHLEALLLHGEPPTSILRRIVLDES